MKSIWGTHDEFVVCFLINFNLSLGLHLFKDVEVPGAAAMWLWDQLVVGAFGLNCFRRFIFVNDGFGLL